MLPEKASKTLKNLNCEKLSITCFLIFGNLLSAAIFVQAGSPQLSQSEEHLVLAARGVEMPTPQNLPGDLLGQVPFAAGVISS